MQNDDWRGRLAQAIKDARKSKRSVSIDSGNGKGYVHSILEEGKDPGIENLFAVCDAIPVSPIWVLYGIEAKPDDVEILRALHKDGETREAILTLIGARKAS